MPGFDARAREAIAKVSEVGQSGVVGSFLVGWAVLLCRDGVMIPGRSLRGECGLEGVRARDARLSGRDSLDERLHTTAHCNRECSTGVNWSCHMPR
ncbi:hypothetical protein EJ03DRAFT_59538 [Teratosphaeria nubilosa]|uniref:Uncharacterized protein n=1 Tax=Teratosphaeria nubilosa TaxID=161662 RepID=A0A6G1LCM4_9PEZI|nr:hypothetical protein EJ03DRAFT_59538 [Teratosphaeria nubilosa]